MADKYSGYAELRASEPSDAFEIALTDRNSPVAIVAPHGGRIEHGTTEIALAIASDELSVYAFTGKKAADNGDLHITSTKFDEPMAFALLARSEVCITVHGAAGTEAIVFLGGLHEALKELVRDRLTSSGFVPADPEDEELRGTDPLNICNRGTAMAGVQLELTSGLRDLLTDPGNPGAFTRLAAFAAAIRAAVAADAAGVQGYLVANP